MRVSRILPFALASALSVSVATPVAAETVSEREPGTVTLVYKVIGTKGDEVRTDIPLYRWKTRIVAEDEVDAVMEELKADPTIGPVEISQPVRTITPVEVGPMNVSPQPMIDEDPLYDDPILPEQLPWQTNSKEYPGRMSIGDAHKVFDTDTKVTMGVVDSGFAETGDVTFKAGGNFAFGASSPEYRATALDPSCTFRHGTRVSHLAAAKFNNGFGMSGIANADLVAARALDCTGSGLLSDTATSVIYLSGEPVAGVTTLSEPVDVINMSLGAWTGVDGCPAYMSDAFEVARSKGVVLVAAAGNEGYDAALYSPANCPGVITVGANTDGGSPTSYSNFGDTVDVYATGNVTTMDDITGKTYVYGTSFSSPIVAAHAALAKAMMAESDYYLINRLMKNSVVPLVTEDARYSDRGILNGLKLAQATTNDNYVSAQFSHALMNEDRTNTVAYTQAAAGLDTCSLYEADTTKIDELDRPEGDFYKVFEVPKSSDFLVSNGVEVARSQGSRVLVKIIDPSVNDYGIAVCSEDNSVCSTAVPVNLNAGSALTQAYCG